MSDVNDQDSKYENSEVERHRRAGRLWEILFVLAVTAGVALLGYGIRSKDVLAGLASAIPFGLAVAWFLAAARSSSMADFEIVRTSNRSRYLISAHRIETLKQVSAPEDVTNFLQTIRGRYPLKQGKLLGELRKALGSERTKEVKSIVMKYTRVDREHALELLKQIRISKAPQKHRKSENSA